MKSIYKNKNRELKTFFHGKIVIALEERNGQIWSVAVENEAADHIKSLVSSKKVKALEGAITNVLKNAIQDNTMLGKAIF